MSEALFLSFENCRKHCAVPENIHTPPNRRDWNFLGGGGFCKAKIFKEMYEAQPFHHHEWPLIDFTLSNTRRFYSSKGDP